VRNRLGQFILITLAVFGQLFHATPARSDTVYVWSGDGTIKQFGTNGVVSELTNGFSGWNGPVGLTLDAYGNLYSGNPGNGLIVKFPPNGAASLVGPWRDSVSGVAFDGTGNLYWTSPNFNELIKDGFTYTQSHLWYPLSLAFDRAGNIFVANSVGPFHQGSPYTNTIEKFSPDCVHLGTFATNLNQPAGLAFDSSGNLFVSNSGTNGSQRNRILMFTPDGNSVVRATSLDGLNSPRGLAFDSAGYLYVANAGNGTIQKFYPYGFGAGSIIASNLTAPTSIAIQPGIKFWKATPFSLGNPIKLPGGAFQFSFTNTPTVSFSAFAATNVASPLSNWTALGGVTEVSLGQFQFTDPAANSAQRFYRVRSP
jgi:sugar lactone lactonase YvrE